MDAIPPIPAGAGCRRDLVRGWVMLALALAPSLAAILAVREFSTQDGPAHLYNARILNASLFGGSPLSETFDVVWQPLPNWVGHLATMALVAWLPPDVAARGITILTLVGFAASLTWLRWAVAGPKGLATASILASLLALNVTWLLGFTSFLIGAALMPATLALWWGGRERFGPWRAMALSGLLVLGYFCHPISLGLTLVGLVILALVTPGRDWLRRGLWTAWTFVPMLPLGLAYQGMTRSGGRLGPVWEHLKHGPWSFSSWAVQLGWVDPLSLAAKAFRPFEASGSPFHGLISPAFLTLAAVGLLAASSVWNWAGQRRGWPLLAGLLLAGGLLGPDSLGVKHGHFLQQRVVLLGLAMLLPWLDFEGVRRSNRLAQGLLGLALLIQSAFVWDYALDCRDRLGRFAGASPAIGSGQKVGTLLAGIRGRFRANPMLHADCLFGVRGDNVIWNNYETAHYYFPVKVRAELDHPSALAFEHVSLLDGDGEAPERAARWEELLTTHGDSIDVIVEWSPQGDAHLDSINARRYDRTLLDGPLRVWTRRELPSESGEFE